jgi:serine/threonine protein kinase
LKDNPTNENVSISEGQMPSSRVTINGGTNCYQAPELFSYNAKFSRKADVFAVGVMFLELLTLHKPNTLYRDLYPDILKVKLPVAMLQCLSGTLDFDPEKRLHFTQLLVLLRSREGQDQEMVLGSSLALEAGVVMDEVTAEILRLISPSYTTEVMESSSMWK